MHFDAEHSIIGRAHSPEGGQVCREVRRYYGAIRLGRDESRQEEWDVTRVEVLARQAKATSYITQSPAQVIAPGTRLREYEISLSWLFGGEQVMTGQVYGLSWGHS